MYHFTSLLYYHSTARYNFVHLNVILKISPLEELVGGGGGGGGGIPPPPPSSSSQRLTGMQMVTDFNGREDIRDLTMTHIIFPATLDPGQPKHDSK